MRNLQTFFMESWLEENRFSAKYNLGESGGRARTVFEILSLSGLKKDQISNKFLNIKLNDSPNWGRNDLRQTVANFHSPATADNILITTGTSEALFLLFRILQPKRLALAMPAFQLLYELPESFGTKIISLPIYWDSFGHPFFIKTEWIKILHDTKPDCLLINNPHNPSGLVFDREFLDELKSTVRRWDAKIIGDEHYRFLASHDETLGHTLYDGEPDVFVTGSFIKCVGTPGLRIGWCVGNQNTLAKMQNEKNYTTHTISPIIEWIAFEVLKNLKSKLFFEIKKEWIKNKEILGNFLMKSNFLQAQVPHGGLVTSVGFKNCLSLETALQVIALLKEKGIFVLPLSAMEFGTLDFQKNLKNSGKYSSINQGFGFRLGLGIESKLFLESLESISKICSEFSNNGLKRKAVNKTIP